MDHHVKSVNTDERSRKRFRFASSKQRSKQASADVYRNYKRRIGVTSAASREERVFHPHREESAKKRQRRAATATDDANDKAIVTSSGVKNDPKQTTSSTALSLVKKAAADDDLDVTEATFSEELDLANDRNASEIFREFYKDVWPLARSLPEVLHHASKIVDLLLVYMLSNESNPHAKSTPFSLATSKTLPSSSKRDRFILNHATTDILHLLAVLAKDIRHEIHPYLHEQIIPRLVTDLLNQPTTSPIAESNNTNENYNDNENNEEEEEDPQAAKELVSSNKQFMPIDVSIIEAAFRTLSYIFRYDADALLAEVVDEHKKSDPCLEKLRQYYGATLAHRRDVVRRLAAETFAPLVRKLKSESARRRHLRRVVRALMTTVATASSSQSSSAATDSSSSKTASAMRLQANAIDGIAHLFFEVARGVSGQINSKGKVAAKVLLDVLCSDGKKDMTPAGRELVHSVTSSFLRKLCYHMHRKYIGDILRDVVSTTQRVLNEVEGKAAPEEFDFGPQQYMVQLLIQLVLFRDGTLLEHRQDEQKYKSRGELTKLVVRVLDVLVPVFSKLSASIQLPVLNLLNSTWKKIPTDPQFARQMRKHIDHIAQCHPGAPSDEESEPMQHPAHVLARDLVPYLPPTTGMGIVGTSILSAAAGVADENSELCLSLVLSVAKSSPVEDSDDNKNEPEDSLFSLERAAQCRISADVKEKLLEACLLDLKDSKDSLTETSRLGVASLCISFLALAGVKNDDEEDEKSFKNCFDKASKWLLEVFNANAKRIEQDVDDKLGHTIVASLALESLARLSMDFDQRDMTSRSSIKKVLSKAQAASERILLSNPTSHWTLRSAAAYVQALQLFDLVLEEKDAIFDALVPNLRSSSHFRRLYALQILGSLPKKPFVTDHADLDLADDLDEEANEFAAKAELTKGGSARSGLCDIIDTLTSIESTPIELHNERRVLSLISRVEILGRTAKLPVIYTEAAANHMLGILHIRFSPIWPNAVRAFVSLATGQDSFVWSPLKHHLTKLMSQMPAKVHQVTLEVVSNQGNEIAQHHDLCKVWDDSNGTNPKLFGRAVSSRLPTDEATVLQHLWSVLEGAPQLLAKHSREIVPIFLQFMHSQFYAHHPHDPDARELRIDNHIEDKTRLDRDVLLGYIIHQRLVSILKVFAAIKGPKQLFKHSLLLSIFKSLLGQDVMIARLAFSCVMTFKIPAVMAFSDSIEGLLAKGGLKEGLLKFNTALETTAIDKQNRRSLIPIVTRVVFGRLSARSGNKSSKDSPAARRAAVLSFMALFCESEDDLYPFVYLMIRNYVPDRQLLIPVEEQEETTRKEILQNVTSVSVDTMGPLPTQAHIGFLYLLEPVTRQLGHRLTNFVDQFTCIILGLCKLAEIKQASPSDLEKMEDEGIEGAEENETSTKGFGALRTLCFRRLSELFGQFAQVIDFSDCGPPMWDAIKNSVSLLPSTVVHCAKVPASLSFLLTLSSHEQLVPLLLMHGEAVPCAIKCLADTSTHPVVDTALSFIDNLLSYDETHAALANSFVIRGHVDLILRQFMIRLGAKAPPPSDAPPGNKGNAGNKPLRSQTWRRELRILCGITEIVEQDENSEKHFDRSEVAEKLCTLLAPYLDPGKFVAEADQLNVLKIMEAMMPKVGTTAGGLHFEQMAKLLGPVKGRPGILSFPLRQGIAATLSKAPQKSHSEATKVAGVLQRLCKTHTKRVDEMDYDTIIPVLVSLVDSESNSSWFALATTAQSGSDTKLISPLMFTCLHYLFNDDGVVCRGAFKALKNLIRLAAQHSDLEAEGQTDDQTEAGQWEVLLQKYLVPAVRAGLSTRNTTVRRLYILLMAEVARACKESPRPNLYGDLAILIRDDDPDLDFFLNITHVQMHRKTRALQRLRKALVAPEGESHCERPFTLQSLSNVLLPMAMHPVYESKRTDEESLAIEAIATVGAISRHLSWSKYNNTLWTSLTQFHRHEEQERYLVGMICALIDGFHFDIISTPEDDPESGTAAEGSNGGGTAVWRALERRFIPKIESLLIKEKVDRSGTKTKILRASLILALVKLFKKCSKSIFEARLPRLLTVVCDGLKSRDSDARDLARSTLAKVVVDIEMDYLPDVLREVTLALRDGFRLHVRIATVHSILLAISEKYTPPVDCTDEEALHLPFDKSVPALMDIIEQDLFGVAQERKEVEGVQGRYVKEASGSKSHNAIELVSSLIVFRPSLAKDYQAAHSSIHAVVSPLIERLKMPNVEIKTIRRVKECLSRVVAGLTRNPTVSIEEVLPFVYATASPFIGNADFTSALLDNSEDSSDDEEPVKTLHVSGGSTKQSTDVKPAEIKKGSVADWRPSSLKSSKTSKGAANVRRKEAKDLRSVQDGASAPKLTGSSRYTASMVASVSKINDPANIGAVVFSLRLLYSVLKKRRAGADLVALVDPFIPLLTACVCTCRETDVVLLALRCLGIFLSFDVSSKEACAPALGTKTLELLSSSGAGSNQNNELSQACFKMLIMLMNQDKSKGSNDNPESAVILGGEEVLAKSSTMPLDSEQMKILISFLQESIVDTDNHNAALNLVKAMMSRRFVSPEFYDLMETILNLSVKSPKAPLRLQCAGIVINYLLNYPLGDERLEQHLKQIVVNVKYEFEEGRLSAINLVTMVVEKVPEPVLEKYVQLFFLPLTIQLVNDDSQKCREGVANCLSSLLRRVSTEVVQYLFDFASRWSQGDGEVQTASLQLFGLFVDSREDFLKRGDTVSQLVERVKDIVVDKSLDEATWETFYFSLLCLEKLTKPFPKILVQQHDLWTTITACLAHPHHFLKLVSSRLINHHLESLDALSFPEDGSKTFLVEQPGSLYQVARNLCFQLNAEEHHQNDEVSTLCIKALCWLLPAMKKHPTLCYADESEHTNSDNNSPVAWVMKRLSSIAKLKGPQRRQAVFKAFAAFATVCPDIVVPTHLELMLEPLHRVDIEITNDVEKAALISAQHHRRKRRSDQPEGESIPAEAVLARDVLRLLEDSCEPQEQFLTAYAAVKTRAREKKESRKLEIKSEAIRDPQAAAKRRQKNNLQEQQRKKRRVDERRIKRGGTAMRRQFD